MKYLFVLGRNINLSIAEVLNFLERFDNPAKSHLKNKNALLVEVDKTLEKNAIIKLGGVIVIGEVIENLDDAILYHGTKNKLNYVLWNFTENIEKYSDYLKKRFRKEKLKATKKLLTGKIDSHGGKKFKTVGSKLIDEQYFVFNDSFGRIIQTCNYDEIENRDMKKPVRREALAISPRLSKIMINLSQIKKGTLVDPFCGIGGVLYEALLQKLSVIGIDIDSEAIPGAKKNLEWGNFSKSKYKLIRGNSKTVNAKGDCIVTEPDLGYLLKKTSKQEKAMRNLERFEKLMIGVLNNLKNKISGRIVFTAPYVKGKKCNIKEILSKTELEIVEGPFLEIKRGGVVGREIFVLR